MKGTIVLTQTWYQDIEMTAWFLQRPISTNALMIKITLWMFVLSCRIFSLLTVMKTILSWFPYASLLS